MSAFVVGTDHIDYLVSAAVTWHGLAVSTLYLNEEQAAQVLAHGGQVEGYQYGAGQVWKPAHRVDALGRLLLAENVRSVSARYPNDTFEELPGPRPMVRPEDYTHRFVPHAFIEPAQVINAIKCWQYQTCEYEGSDTAPGWLFTERLYRVAVDRLMGDRDGLLWEWDRDAAAKAQAR
jgi:hypothetical protein